MIEAVGANNMPPEGEPELDDDDRNKLLAHLKLMLRQASTRTDVSRIPIRRLNRFQYNNVVNDLFRLDRDVFELPEKLMTRHENYLHAVPSQMPDTVEVASHALKPQAGMRDVKSFPKDLRASHGFDNQANQLTLSPLLLDAFLRLSVSIVESPDFNPQTVGIWNEFFQEPGSEDDLESEVRSRLEHFLTLAFRRSVDPETLERYTEYAMSRIGGGASFTESMKKVASAALSSPNFLFWPGSGGEELDQVELASRLSFFLWGSCPDLKLIRLADSGELAEPGQLEKTIDRMLADPKIERFLDTFPAQWMQLENVLAATPDPNSQRLFSLDESHPASLQMVLEPLLLFDAVFIEDRPVIELVSPAFSYRSEFLGDWYTSDLKPNPIDEARIAEQNRMHQMQREALDRKIEGARSKLAALIDPIRARLLARRKDSTDEEPIDLSPFSAWEFNGDLKDSINSLDLEKHGEIQFQEGMVVLEDAYLLSRRLPFDLKAKSLEVWFKLHDLNQSGGGLMGIQGPGDFFDTIVLGERKAQHWISGSNGFSRTDDFPGSTPESNVHDMLHLVMVYHADGTTALYRNGMPYGQPFRKDPATFPKNETSVIFGLRHLPPGGDRYLTVSLDRARFYDRALTVEEIALSSRGNGFYITEEELQQALTSDQKVRHDSLTKSLTRFEADLKRVPPYQDIGKLREESYRRFDDEIRERLRSRTFARVASEDPRYGGVITNAAMLSMTSGPKRTHPIARGAWIIEVIFNDPPPPPPNDVPPLNEDQTDERLTIREKFAKHRENPDCAGCHSRLDPLGFALENYDITGRWRDRYENGREVDASGMLLRKHKFGGSVDFKASLLKEDRRFVKAFTGHLLRYALSRELSPFDSLTVDAIVEKAEPDNFKLRTLIKEVIRSDGFANVGQ